MRKTSPTFVHDIPLVTTESDEREFEIRLEAARQVYNACIGECLKRIKLIRESKSWNKARKGFDMKKSDRFKLFNDTISFYKLTDFDMQDFSTKIRHGDAFIETHLDCNSCNAIGTRAFIVCKDYLFGIKKRPKFRRVGEIYTVTGKSNSTGIRFVGGKFMWNVKGGKSVVCEFMPMKDKFGVHAHAISSRVKFVRLIKKLIHRKWRWYMQLVLEGIPLQKPKNFVGKGHVHIKVSSEGHMSVVGSNGEFSDIDISNEIRFDGEKRRLYRSLSHKISRNKLLAKKDNGRFVKGDRLTYRSKRYIATKTKLASLFNREREEKEKKAGYIANAIIRMGDTFSIDTDDYKKAMVEDGKKIFVSRPSALVCALEKKLMYRNIISDKIGVVKKTRNKIKSKDKN